MKNKFHVPVITSLFLGLLLISCGPKDKLEVSEAKVDQLQEDSAKTHNQLDDSKARVKYLREEKESLQDENAAAQTLSDQSQMTIADQQKRLNVLQNIIQTQRNVMAKLKNSVSEALLSYKADELNVYIKDGNVYVSLEEKLLFKSGSDVVDSKGKDALKTLAKVLNNTKDITVLIEGHTDDVPIKTKEYSDNWDLSTARATSIVRLLTKDYGFDSDRITASGRSNFHPVKSNKTAAGRAANRRTEVILSPDMKELYKMF